MLHADNSRVRKASFGEDLAPQNERCLFVCQSFWIPIYAIVEVKNNVFDTT